MSYNQCIFYCISFISMVFTYLVLELLQANFQPRPATKTKAISATSAIRHSAKSCSQQEHHHIQSAVPLAGLVCIYFLFHQYLIDYEHCMTQTFPSKSITPPNWGEWCNYCCFLICFIFTPGQSSTRTSKKARLESHLSHQSQVSQPQHPSQPCLSRVSPAPEEMMGTGLPTCCIHGRPGEYTKFLIP